MQYLTVQDLLSQLQLEISENTISPNDLVGVDVGGKIQPLQRMVPGYTIVGDTTKLQYRGKPTNLKIFVIPKLGKNDRHDTIHG